MYYYDNVIVFKSDRDKIEIDGVIYCHGWMTGCVAHMRHFNKPVVHGHSHRADKEHTPLRKSSYKDLWEMDLGWFGDEKLVPFGYTNSAFTGWSTGVGIITDGVPKLLTL